VPSARDLAAQFGTARGTVDAAYAILGGEGCLISRGAGGTVVNTEFDSRAVERAASQQRQRSRAEPPGTHKLLPLQLGLPALDAFPRKVWSRLVARQIARYLASSRGVRCTAEQILITNGYQDALNLAANVLLRPRDKVWLEDPGYPPAADAAQGRRRGTGANPCGPGRKRD
jgi:GntR family transcriptional regulator/MocR family aminotransferase